MMMTKIIQSSLLLTAMVCILSLNGCEHTLDGIAGSAASNAGYNQVLRSWLGAPELDVIRSFGVPTQTYEVSGHKFLVYDRQISWRTPETYTTTFVGNTAYTDSDGGYVHIWQCSTTFETDGSKVVNFQFQGNACAATAVPPAPEAPPEPTPSSDGLVHINVVP